MSLFISILAFLVVITILVGIHEGGHFYAAKLFKVGIRKFAIGMGPVLYSKTGSDGCSYELRALPLGGFVQMVGDGDPASVLTSDELTEEEKKQAFSLKPKWQKSIIVAAGPLVNFIFGILIFTVLFSINEVEVTPPVIAEIVQGDPADIAGLRPGDTILKINDQNIKTFADVRTVVFINLDNNLDIVVERGGQSLDFTVTPKIIETKNFIGSVEKMGMIGIKSESRVFEKTSILQAFKLAINEFWNTINTTLTALNQIFQGQRGIDDLGGPVKIAEMSGAAVGISFQFYFMLMAVISINLGLMNLFPVPVLDGGHLTIYAIEGIIGRSLSAKSINMTYKVSMFLLLTLFIVISANDMISLFERHLL